MNRTSGVSDTRSLYQAQASLRGAPDGLHIYQEQVEDGPDHIKRKPVAREGEVNECEKHIAPSGAPYRNPARGAPA